MQSWSRVGRVGREIGRGLAAVLAEHDASPTLRRPSRPLRRPVLLLHGFASTPLLLAPLERSLRRLGREVVRVPISPGREDLRDSARQVMRVLAELAANPAFEYADVVGHSMGGLVATYLLKHLDRGQRIRSVVTLGTPHLGTPLAALGVLLLGRMSRAVWQLLPRSEFTRDLASLPVPTGSSLVSISGGSDWVVPASFSEVAPAEGSEHRTICGGSHTGFLTNSGIHALVASLLERGSRQPLARAA